MGNYVEWLRVRNCLRITAIVMAAILVLAGVLALFSIDHREQHVMPLGAYGAFAAIVAIIVATVLGAPFARENDGHLEIAFTKPFDRAAIGVAAAGADLAGIALAWLLAFVVGAIAHAMLYPLDISANAQDWFSLAISLLGPFAWYAMLAAATSSLKSGYGAILGLSWPVSGLIVVLSLIPATDNVMWNAIRGIFVVLASINPLRYAHVDGGHAMGSSVGPAPPLAHPSDAIANIVMLAILFIVYGALAIVQWRRVEA